MVLHSICVKYGKTTDFRNFPFNIAIRSQCASDCLWASLWLSKDHEEFKRVAMKNSFPITLFFFRFRAARSAHTDRTQRCAQYAGIAGLENTSLVKNYVADIFNDENAQRPPQFHEKTSAIGRTKQKEGRERGKTEKCCLTHPDSSQPRPPPPGPPQPTRQPTHPGGTRAGARVGRKSFFLSVVHGSFFLG